MEIDQVLIVSKAQLATYLVHIPIRYLRNARRPGFNTKCSNLLVAQLSSDPPTEPRTFRPGCGAERSTVMIRKK